MNTPPRFALIGVGGFVAPRHLRAIKEVGGALEVALDPNDSVGIMDSYFPQARFFTEFERFDRYIDLCRRRGEGVDFMSICSPNYLHDSNVRFALRSGADAICEKPLVLNPHNIDGLQTLEEETGRKVNTILQLRLHPTIIALREKILSGPKDAVADVSLTYVTSRGRWYHSSWKGDEAKSGGIATNIGVHFYDMLSFVFGDLVRNVVHYRAADRAAGYLEYERARVRWFLSINIDDVPPAVREKQSTFRSITVDGEEIEFSDGFTDLHTASYREVIAGRGFSLAEVRPSIATVAHIRNAPLEPDEGEAHPFLATVLASGEGRNDERA
ncbi:Gfo/Idh/MocA family oxidoreductase [Caulobacter sp. NIBR1757]|uniref:Gfo/Idh/MocA family protein n=1 Tax=Caulobacter sp. NIBR1757 TaxID=3016000 RepID=UPI0022F020CC|nr:Gfo/Idh/MocA family oxidoreductase [Caulobacter sp. NIBR1757]WGM40030.1 UDP-N-acetyl-2-amino-2-deoxy-D-glucuronate oxidase [Caulobacter sp. NIBR1757]